MRLKSFKSSKSVTLIELVMLIVIVGILAGVSSMYIKETIDLWRFLSYRSEVVAQGRLAVMRMEREIRQVRDKDSILTANSSRFRFIDRSATTIDYQLSGNNLMRNTDVLATGVTGLTFCYYDNNNQSACAPTAACSCSPVSDTTVIYRIVIKMDISAGNETKHLETQVYPRNLT